MINIGKYIEIVINWMTEHWAHFFDVINNIIGGFIETFQHGLLWIPFYIMIPALTVLAWYKAGKGTAVLTLLGLFLIYGMGFWEQTMQTVALVLSSTVIALILGVPLGIWTAQNRIAAKIIRPVMDLMQTMPAFVYLIPAVLFFGLGPVPGAFATVIFAMPPVVRLTDLGIRSDFPPATFQSTAAVGVADDYDGSESNDYDGIVYGGDCCNDLRRRFGGDRIERYYPDEDRSRI